MALHFPRCTLRSFGLALLLSFGFLNCEPGLAQESSGDNNRVWRDSNGKFEVTAELKSQDEDEVVLLTDAGKKITVKKNRLSEPDRKYLKSLDKKPSGKTGSAESTKSGGSNSKSDAANQSEIDPELLTTLKANALEFYSDLRTDERTVAIELLTPSARELAKAKQSGFGLLPKPDNGNQSIKIGKPAVKDNEASIPVTVRVNKKNLKTIIYFSKDDDDRWLVTSIGSIVKNKEAKINFEESNAEKEKDSVASLVGKPIELSGVTIEGSPVALEELKGKVVLIDFWATWCGPCIAEIPNIKENYDKYHEAGFEVLAVSVDKDLKALAEFVKEEQPPWTVLADRHPKNRESMGQKFGITGIPTFILVGRDGKVAAVNCRGKQLGKKLEELLESDVSVKSE